MVQALDGIDARFLGRLQFDVYILPFPVEEPMGSWTDGKAVYLSPGVLTLTEQQIRFLASHEVGHLVHRSFLPDGDHEGWDRYRMVRGIQDTTRYFDGAIHADRPHEIFAEDFRFLFGSTDIGSAEPIENSGLASPDRVDGLREYFLELIGERVEPDFAAARLYPNPVGAEQTLRLRLGSSEIREVTVFDVNGRKIADASPTGPTQNGEVSLVWDGHDRAGNPLAGGVYYVAARTSSGDVAKIPFTYLPR